MNLKIHEHIFNYLLNLYNNNFSKSNSLKFIFVKILNITKYRNSYV